MDTSETYIKMCEKAVEIQPIAKPVFRDEDRFQITPNGSNWIQKDVSSTDWRVIWLPRQDQLQELIRQHFDDCDIDQLHAQLNIFIDWFNAHNGYWRIRAVKTYEQLWLAFVMHEKYNKVWNGEDWIDD